MQDSSEILNLYIVRHGQTDYNLNGKFQGTSDIPLNENGLAQAADLAAKLASIPFTSAYHSPLNRARTTCEMIVDGRIPITADGRLIEVYFGMWEGMHRDDIEHRWPEQFKNYYSNIGLFDPPGGESLIHARDRAAGFYEELIGEDTHGNILIVAHQFINALLCTCIMGQDIDRAWDYRSQPGEVLLFELDGETITYRKIDL